MAKANLALTGSMALLLILAADASRSPRLVWNATASVPVGLYRIVQDQPRHSDIVAIRLPAPISALAVERHYLPVSALLLKPVAGSAGSRVCRWGHWIFVNQVPRAVALSADAAGRPLPAWHGCMQLSADQVFVLGTRRDSFDSRYFGAIPKHAVVGRAVPLFIRSN